MESYENISRRECQNKCKDTAGCLGIEYFKKSYADNAADVYKHKDCNLSDSIDIDGCDAGQWQMWLSAYLEVDCYTYEVIEQTHVTHTYDYENEWNWDLSLDWFGD